MQPRHTGRELPAYAEQHEPPHPIRTWVNWTNASMGRRRARAFSGLWKSAVTYARHGSASAPPALAPKTAKPPLGFARPPRGRAMGTIFVTFYSFSEDTGAAVKKSKSKQIVKYDYVHLVASPRSLVTKKSF
jgi:hypothetical protein